MTAGCASALACVAAALLALAGCRRADVDAPVAGPSIGYATAQAASAAPGPDERASSGGGERDCIVAAAPAGSFARPASPLAAARAATPEVRSLATMMVGDHTNANGELAQLAAVRARKSKR